jgi:hypothetical protein
MDDFRSICKVDTGFDDDRDEEKIISDGLNEIRKVRQILTKVVTYKGEKCQLSRNMYDMRDECTEKYELIPLTQYASRQAMKYTLN